VLFSLAGQLAAGQIRSGVLDLCRSRIHRPDDHHQHRKILSEIDPEGCGRSLRPEGNPNRI